MEIIVQGCYTQRTTLKVSLMVLTGVRHISSVSGAACGADDGAASEASCQDALRLLCGRGESVRGSQPSRHCVSRLPI